MQHPFPATTDRTAAAPCLVEPTVAVIAGVDDLHAALAVPLADELGWRMAGVRRPLGEAALAAASLGVPAVPLSPPAATAWIRLVDAALVSLAAQGRAQLRRAPVVQATDLHGLIGQVGLPVACVPTVPPYLADVVTGSAAWAMVKTWVDAGDRLVELNADRWLLDGHDPAIVITAVPTVPDGGA